MSTLLIPTFMLRNIKLNFYYDSRQVKQMGVKSTVWTRVLN